MCDSTAARLIAAAIAGRRIAILAGRAVSMQPTSDEMRCEQGIFATSFAGMTRRKKHGRSACGLGIECCSVYNVSVGWWELPRISCLHWGRTRSVARK
jgi:hypothetical protein